MRQIIVNPILLIYRFWRIKHSMPDIVLISPTQYL